MEGQDKAQSQKFVNKLPLTLGFMIKVDHAEIISSSESSSPSNSAQESRSRNGAKHDSQEETYSRTPSHFDPNLGLVPYLLPLNIPYKRTMNQPWNIAPYFLDTLPQSSCCDLNNCILIIGGLNPKEPDDFVLSSSIFEFHVSSQTWHYYGSMLEPRCYHAACFVGSFLYITGGYSALQRRDGEMLAIPSTDRLDIKTTLWKRCADMKTARASHAMVAMGKYLYVFGGRNPFGRIIASVEMYDIEEDIWMEILQLPRPAMGLSATCINNEVWILGGIIEDKEKTITSNVYTLNISNRSWRVQKSLPGPHAFMSCVSSGNTIWVAGGSHKPEKRLVSCQCIWSLKVNRKAKWTLAATLSEPTHSGCSVICGKELYVFGGISSQKRKVKDKVEILNIETGILRKGVSLPVAITGSSSIFLDEKASNCKSKKRVKSLVRCKDFDRTLTIDQTKPFKIHASTPAEATPKERKKILNSNFCLFEESTSSSEYMKKTTFDRSHSDFEDQSFTPSSDSHEPGSSKSSEEISAIHTKKRSSLQQSTYFMSKASHQINCDFSDCEDKVIENGYYLESTRIGKHSSSDKSSDEHTRKKDESHRRYFQVKQISAKDDVNSKNITGHRQNCYKPTLEVSLGEEAVGKKYRLNNLQSMKTEMTLENGKWKRLEIGHSDSNSGSSWENHSFKLYSPPPKWKMKKARNIR